MDLEETAAPSTNLSIQLAWLEKYSVTTNSGKWKPLFDLKLANYGHDFLFFLQTQLFFVSDTKEVVKVIDYFLKQLKYWAETNKLCESS